MTRLERHRLDREGGSAGGVLLRVEDLSRDELAIVTQDFHRRLKADGGRDDADRLYDVYVATLHAWGVMCPHPQQYRSYDSVGASDVPISYDTSRWYDCAMCGASVVNLCPGS